jgi:hypothetical protein
MLKNIQEWCGDLEADPFQVDLENLCPHLRSRFVAKRASSKYLDILDSLDTYEFPPKEYRFDE